MNYTDEDVKRAAGQAMRAGIEAGASQERERIIKLLKKNLKTAQGLMGYSVNTALTESYLHGLEQSISLIKGENK